MYEDEYLNCELAEDQEIDQDTSGGVQCVQKQLTYSTGKFKNGAIGLCNVGVINCLNPLLQTLYMNRDFANILCGIGEPNDNVALECQLPYQLLALFEEMQDSEEDAVPPYRIMRCLKIANMRVFNSYDVAELFFNLWDLLVQQMPHHHLEEKLRTLYTVKLKESMTCRKCSHQRSNDLDVLTIPLQVYHSRHHRNLTLERALRRFFNPTEVTGESCPKCIESSTSVKDLRFLSLPRTLTINVKRLSQKKSFLQKINRTFSFPDTLDLSDVLDPEYLPEGHVQSRYHYVLYAVVAHTGTASSGHFCTYINSWKDHKWYCFNDSSVCRVSWEDVKCSYGNTSFHWGVTACLLVYIQSDKKENA
ncbi:ubl carboxyl-terminal hydrolase 18 [Pelodytes ibericus]